MAPRRLDARLERTQENTDGTIELIPNSCTPALGVAIGVRLRAEIAQRVRELEARHRSALTPHGPGGEIGVDSERPTTGRSLHERVRVAP